MSASTRSYERERAELIAKFMPFARAVAFKAQQGLPIELEDAVQAANLGLTQAAMRFDFEMHDPRTADIERIFKAFAYLRIYGAVIDEARSASMVRRRGLEKGDRAYMVSLDEMTEIDGYETPLVELEAFSDDSDLRIDFTYAFETLNARQKRVITALMSGATGKELAEEFGVTESRVSQIAKEAKDKLLEGMQA